LSHAQADWITLSKIGFPCIVGLYEDEQRTPQRLELELAMGLDLDRAAGGDLAHSVHYVAALDQVQFIAQEGRWRLLESLAGAIARHLLRPPAPTEGRAAIERVRVRVSKPVYLKGRALPAVEIQREKSWVGAEPATPRSHELWVHELLTTKQSGAYHVDLGAFATFTVPDSTSVFVLGGALSKQGDAGFLRGSIARGGETVASVDALGARLLAVGRPLAGGGSTHAGG
jgi:FolB domain-containing protein